MKTRLLASVTTLRRRFRYGGRLYGVPPLTRDELAALIQRVEREKVPLQAVLPALQGEVIEAFEEMTTVDDLYRTLSGEVQQLQAGEITPAEANKVTAKGGQKIRTTEMP